MLAASLTSTLPGGPRGWWHWICAHFLSHLSSRTFPGTCCCRARCPGLPFRWSIPPVQVQPAPTSATLQTGNKNKSIINYHDRFNGPSNYTHFHIFVWYIRWCSELIRSGSSLIRDEFDWLRQCRWSLLELRCLVCTSTETKDDERNIGKFPSILWRIAWGDLFLFAV